MTRLCMSWHVCRSHADAIAKATGCKSSYSLMRLPHHDSVNQTVPDAMHTVKDVLERLFGLLVGRHNTEKVRKAEIQLGRLDLPLQDPLTRKKTKTSTVPYCLSKQQLQLADDRLRCISVPTHVDFHPRPIFVKLGYMKSHDWKQVLHTHVQAWQYTKQFTL